MILLKRKSTIALLFLVLFSWLSSCVNTQQKSVEETEKEVMDVHDQTMAKLGQIEMLSQEIKKIIDELNMDTVKDQTASIEKLNDQLDELEKAHEAMMNWMHHYKPPEKDQQKEAALKYLNEEKEKINTVAQQMMTSIDEAEKTLEPYRNNR